MSPFKSVQYILYFIPARAARARGVACPGRARPNFPAPTQMMAEMSPPLPSLVTTLLSHSKESWWWWSLELCSPRSLFCWLYPGVVEVESPDVQCHCLTTLKTFYLSPRVVRAECSLDIRILTQKTESDDKTCSKYQARCAEWRRVIFRPTCPQLLHAKFAQNNEKSRKIHIYKPDKYSEDLIQTLPAQFSPLRLLSAKFSNLCGHLWTLSHAAIKTAY